MSDLINCLWIAASHLEAILAAILIHGGVRQLLLKWPEPFLNIGGISIAVFNLALINYAAPQWILWGNLLLLIVAFVQARQYRLYFVEAAASCYCQAVLVPFAFLPVAYLAINSLPAAQISPLLGVSWVKLGAYSWWGVYAVMSLMLAFNTPWVMRVVHRIYRMLLLRSWSPAYNDHSG